jgi:8-oxo-dGTP diphosphatase
MKKIEVVAAIIISENKILCVQRNQNKYEYISFKYEFPGGKIEEGESKEQALKREIQEELNMDIDITECFLTVYHQYPDFHLTMHSFICSCKETTMILREHIDFKWLTIEKLQNLNWAAADVPIVEKLVING